MGDGRARSYSPSLLRATIEASASHRSQEDPGNGIELKYLDSSKFFSNWFLLNGDRFIFLFNQNIRQTNIQYVELLSLLRVHISFDCPEDACEFSDSEYFKRGLESLASSLGGKRSSDGVVVQIIEEYLRNKVVIDPRYGSCAVYIPPGCSLSVGDICGEAGYIHSVGRIISFRNAVKLEQAELTDSASKHLARYQNDKRPIFLVPYSHEAFSNEDKGSPFLKGGLDDVKLNLGKMHIGTLPLVNALNNVKSAIEELNIVCFIAQSNNFKEDISDFHETHGSEDVRTWFMIVDSDFNPESRFPVDKKYFVLYEQLFKGSSIYHWFDENKPAWVSHTTLPHSLAAAMINVTRPYWPKGRIAKLCDPFGGSGTVYLEANKNNYIEMRSSDRSPAAEVIALDNIEIFNLPEDKLNVLISDLERMYSDLRDGYGFSMKLQAKRSKEIAGAFSAAKRIVDDGDGDALDAKKELWDEIKRSEAGDSLFKRVRIYCCLKGIVRHSFGVTSGNEAINHAIAAETQTLVVALNGLRKIKCAKETKEFSNKHLFSGLASRLEIIDGPYSVGVRQSPPRPSEISLLGGGDFFIADALNIVKKQFDLIIGDPPYGFNTEEEGLEMAQLFEGIAEKFIAAISDEGGQIVLAVPDVSFTGKPIPAFVSKNFVIGQFMRAAKRAGRKLFQPVYSMPGSMKGMGPPYYWYSEKALKRAILHFWIAPSKGDD